MAYKTVDPSFVVKVKGCVLPPITGMTTRTTGPVADNAHAEIVDDYVGFTQIYPPFQAQVEWRRTFPQPVRTGKHLFTLIRVTAQALPGNFHRIRFFGKFDEILMVQDPLFMASV